MKKLTDREKILQVLQDKANKEGPNFRIYKSHFEQLKLEEKTITNELYSMREDGLISIITDSPHRNLSIPWNIILKSEGKHYFEKQKQSSKSDRREFVRTYIPITISFIALIKSFWPEITWGINKLIELIKNLL